MKYTNPSRALNQEQKIWSRVRSIEQRVSKLSTAQQTRKTVEVTVAASFNVANNTNVTISFDTENYDFGDFWDAGTPDRLIVPLPGFYLVYCGYRFAANNTGYRMVQVRRNGTDIIASSQLLNPQSGRTFDTTFSRTVHLDTDDYIRLRVRQNSGGNLQTIANDFSPILGLTWLM